MGGKIERKKRKINFLAVGLVLNILANTCESHCPVTPSAHLFARLAPTASPSQLGTSPSPRSIANSLAEVRTQIARLGAVRQDKSFGDGGVDVAPETGKRDGHVSARALVGAIGVLIAVDMVDFGEGSVRADYSVPAGDRVYTEGGSRPYTRTGSVTLAVSDLSSPSAKFNGSGSVEEQVNCASLKLDASFLYGDAPNGTLAVRDPNGGGRLLADASGLFPPIDPDTDVFRAPHMRPSLDPGTQAVLTLFFREHNRRATELAALDPSLTDEGLFLHVMDDVRRLWQRIVYEEWMPVVVGALPASTTSRGGHLPPVPEPTCTTVTSSTGHRILRRRAAPDEGHAGDGHVHERDLRGGHVQPSPTASVDGCVDSAVETTFSTVFLPAMLSLSPGAVAIADGEGSIVGFEPLAPNVYDTEMIRAPGSMDRIVMGLAYAPARVPAAGPPEAYARVDERGVTRDFFAEWIQRGRDHGVPTYNALAAALGLPGADSFAAFPDPLNVTLAELYGATTGGVDFLVGALATSHSSPGEGILGDHLRAVLAHQFARTREADPDFYSAASSAAASVRAGHVSSAVPVLTFADLVRQNVADPSSVRVFPASPFSGSSSPASSGSGSSPGTGAAVLGEGLVEVLGGKLNIAWRADTSQDRVTFTVTAPGRQTWIAMGINAEFGEGMSNADIVAGWIDRDTGSGVVVDLRATAQGVVPRRDNEIGGAVSIESASFELTNDGEDATLTFTRSFDTGDTVGDIAISSDPSSEVPVIFAVGGSFNFGMHVSANDRGLATLRLFEGTAGSLSSGIPTSTYVHGVGMTVAWLICMPIGVYFSRYRKVKTAAWMSFHKLAIGFGTTSAIPLVLAAALTSRNRGQDYHSTAAYVFIIVALMQVIVGSTLGAFFKGHSYATRFKSARTYHRLSGRFIFCFAMSQVATGFIKIQMPIFGWIIAGCWLTFMVGLYIFEEIRSRRLAPAGSKIPEGIPVMSRSAFEAGAARGMSWVILDGCVLDIVGWAVSHPGGTKVVEARIGTDISDTFHGREPGSVRHSSAALNRAAKLCIGTIYGSNADLAAAVGARNGGRNGGGRGGGGAGAADAGSTVDFIDCRITAIAHNRDEGRGIDGMSAIGESGGGDGDITHVLFSAEPLAPLTYAPLIRPGHHVEVSLRAKDDSFPAIRLLTPLRPSVATDPCLEFVVRIVPDGELSRAMIKAAKDDIIQISVPNPCGLLVVPTPRAKAAFFFGGGTGVAAFVSYFRAMSIALSIDEEKPEGFVPSTLISLHRSVPLFDAELKGIAERSKGLLRVHTVLSAPPPGHAGPQGRLTLDLILQVFGDVDPADTDCYFAGPPAMEEAADRVLAEAGVPARRRRRLGVSEGQPRIQDGERADGVSDAGDFSDSSGRRVAGEGYSDDESHEQNAGGGAWWESFTGVFTSHSGKEEKDERALLDKMHTSTAKRDGVV